MLETFGIFNFGKEIFSSQNLFLIAIALVWIFFASIQDFKKREVENWWNFSFIIFVLAFRAFLSIETGEYMYFVFGIAGFALGFILANLFYYGRIFAGGDAKLLMGLGCVLPLSLSWQTNLLIFLLFLMLFLIVGGIYGAIFSFILAFKNIERFKTEFSKQLKKYKKIAYIAEMISASLILLSFAFSFYAGVYLGLILFFSPLLLIYARAVEESCMISRVSIKNLTIGDWLYEKVKIGKRTIKPDWEGLSESELNLIQRKLKGKILVKAGIPFVPAFFIAFIILLVILHYNLL